jgi:hypothetical protein
MTLVNPHKRIVLINKSAKYTAVQMGLSQIASALSWQMATCVKPGYDLGHVPQCIVGKESDMLPTDGCMFFYDQATTPNALGDHWESQDGKIVREVFISPIIDNGGTFTYGANSVSACASHELIEAWFNPFVDRWLDMPNGSDTPDEKADAVENDCYAAPNNVAVSNFILEAWSDPSAKGGPGVKFDWMGKLSAPFTMSPGGYMVVRTEPGTISQVFAKHPVEDRVLVGRAGGRDYHLLFGPTVPEHKRIAKALKLGRKFRVDFDK